MVGYQPEVLSDNQHKRYQVLTAILRATLGIAFLLVGFLNLYFFIMGSSLIISFGLLSFINYILFFFSGFSLTLLFNTSRPTSKLLMLLSSVGLAFFSIILINVGTQNNLFNGLGNSLTSEGTAIIISGIAFGLNAAVLIKLFIVLINPQIDAKKNDVQSFQQIATQSLIVGSIIGAISGTLMGIEGQFLLSSSTQDLIGFRIGLVAGMVNGAAAMLAFGGVTVIQIFIFNRIALKDR